MKRYGNLYEKIYSLDNLRIAHQKARRDKLFYQEVKMVDKNPDFYLLRIQEMLKNQTYKVSPYSCQKINDKGKMRELMKLPYFPDRIIQWAIMLQIEGILIKSFTASTYASIPGRGIHQASKKLQKYLVEDPAGTTYCYKIDIHHFYPNINHDILKKQLGRKFKDRQLLDLIFLIIDSVPGGVGLPIGSYLSQYLANFYFKDFDHWIHEELRIKYYLRYMDDMIFLAGDKPTLHRLHEKVVRYLSKNLKLEIKPNYQIFPTRIRGIDFVGYRHFGNRIILRKRTYKRLKRTMLKMVRTKTLSKPSLHDYCCYQSYKGWLLNCSDTTLFEKYLTPLQNWMATFNRGR